MPSKKLVSFLGKDTPEFDGIVDRKNPKLFNGKVPNNCDYVIANDPNIVEIFEDKGVIDYAKIQQSGNEKSGKDKDASSGGSDSTESSTDSIGNDEFSQYAEQSVRESNQRPGSEGIVPENWESLPFFTQRSIARKLTDEEVKTKEDVVRVISSHLEK